MVDPPPHSSSVLLLYGIAPVLIEGVIVTHCHADHDAGTFHKILEDRRVTVMTTATIMKSFIRKYSAITYVHQDILSKLFDFRAAIIGENMNVRGGKFRFFTVYIQFRVWDLNATMVVSHLYTVGTRLMMQIESTKKKKVPTATLR
eukprot:TRINITY_DN6573_c0_g1_i1.p1 TRINITY_DN6573_c0_g1~~TRINITY_DN6573_c0_g1_i1.p1  ORF type:complete len:146 (-),score=11.03 TRINITY_DN6573_c0_g1_i1:17-454(-)